MTQDADRGSLHNADLDAKPGNQANPSINTKKTTSVTDTDLSPELVKELLAMNSFSDKVLWKTVLSRPSARDAQKLRQLNHKQQKYGQASLTQLERQSLEDLGYQYDRSILLRPQAILLLKERGHDITRVLKASSKTSIITNRFHKTSITP